MKMFLKAGAVALGLSAVASASAADHIYEGQAFYGDWEVFGGGSVYLGDGAGFALDIEGTSMYCDQPGSSYSRMNEYIQSNWPDPVSWFVDEICSQGVVRLCVHSSWGAVACSSYLDYGWVRRW